MSIWEAIEDLEFTREKLIRTCPYKWTRAMEFALNNLRTIANWKKDPVKAIRYFLDVIWMKTNDQFNQEFIDEIISQIEDRMHADK